MSNIIKAPFTDEEVKNLNEFQKLGFVHVFTCGNDHEGNRVLVATNKGWICPSCDYTQNWCHAIMVDVKAIKDNWNNSEFGKLLPVI